MTFLSLKALTKKYDCTKGECVKGIDLDVERGQTVVLLGPSGCGKTTTLKMIAGLVPANSGDILLEGRSILADPPEKRGVSMVFQKTLLFPHMTVAQNIGFGLKMRGEKQGEIEKKVNEMLKLIKLEGYGTRRTTQLSGGQEQRVSLARGLIIEPKVLLLDEPLSALDAKLRQEMRELIQELKERFDVTIIFVTHDQQEAVMLADKIALMIDGEIVQYDAPQAFFTRPRTRSVAEFFGWTNFISAVQTGKEVNCCLGEFQFNELESFNGEVDLAIRPESAELCGTDEGLAATVLSSMYMGTRVHYVMGCMGTQLKISLDASKLLKIGDTIHLKFNQGMIWAVRMDRCLDEDNVRVKDLTVQPGLAALSQPTKILSEVTPTKHDRPLQ